MTDEEMKRLEELAKAATPGPWKHEAKSFGERIDFVFAAPAPIAQMMSGSDDARYIATANPASVLELIERVRKAERKGAEEMRKAVVIRLRETSLGLDVVGRMTQDYDIKHNLYDRSSGYDEAAEDVALLKLPGDAP